MTTNYRATGELRGRDRVAAAFKAQFERAKQKAGSIFGAGVGGLEVSVLKPDGDAKETHSRASNLFKDLLAGRTVTQWLALREEQQREKPKLSSSNSSPPIPSLLEKYTVGDLCRELIRLRDQKRY